VALVNNDAVVAPGWLAPLVDALEADPGRGAACPRILLADRFRAVRLDTPLGAGAHHLEVCGARVGDTDVWARTVLRRDDALRVLLPDGDGPARLCLRARRPTTVSATSGGASAQVAVGRRPVWFDAPFGAPARDLVNNAGTDLVLGFRAKDRGLYEPDGEAFARPADVFAWCGAAVVLTAAYLEDVGRFDERLFLYDEDFELAWRGGRRGWRYRYVPESVVRHRHAATSVDGSPLKEYYDGRNHLLVALRHAPLPAAARAVARYTAATVVRARRAGASRTRTRARALAGFARLAPAMLAERRRDRRVSPAAPAAP
jgi:N-acetylglucosaminyl-diphospho-decaprenol L-rhamnosyltransferase